MKEKSIGFEIKAINDLILKRMICNSKNKNYPNISHTQIKIIHYLCNNKNKVIYQKDIEKMLNLKRSTVSGIIDTMEKNNLIVRKESTQDLRLRQILLTDYALNMGKEIKKQLLKFNKLLEKNISSEELNIFYRVTDKIKNNIINEEE